MKALLGDTVIDDDKSIGIVESRDGTMLRIRYPGQGNQRDEKPRRQVQHLAERIREAREDGRPLQVGTKISLTGDSTLAELVGLFGYSTGQLRRDSLWRVTKQLERAGLEITTKTGNWSRDDEFRIEVREKVVPDEPIEDLGEAPALEHGRRTTPVDLPDTFWPTALGLDRSRELDFLRALTARDPILCLLYLPDQAASQPWLQAVWEGLIGWAFHAGQEFVRRPEFGSTPKVGLWPETLLGAYLKPSVLDPDSVRLLDSPHSLNLITIKRASEPPAHLHHLAAVWPGPIFEFRPEYNPNGAPSADVQSICDCLSLVGGMAPASNEDATPLGMLNWARVAHRHLTAMPITRFGDVLSNAWIGKFKGSNECAVTLALKAHLANWIFAADPDANLEFEHPDEDIEEEETDLAGQPVRRRIDLFVEDLGEFEVESLLGSGPMESFYHKKVLSRKKGDRKAPFWLIVPNDAILWAGPYLGDLACHLGDGGHVMVPAMDEGFLEMTGRPLKASGLGVLQPDEVAVPPELPTAFTEIRLKLKDVAGYPNIKSQINEDIIWPEKHRARLRGISRSSGILFFGPPGCGKTRWAQAIAGELEQEVRLLGPSDLRSPFIGWGQIKIREQFDWLAEGESRMLVIDELDGLAHSRHERQMHTDDKASVNELLIQVDRVLRLGRLLAATTNFIGSLDEALTRSGRFGRFIPVAPPDLEEAVEIVRYYLRVLADSSGSDKSPAVRVPDDRSRVRALLAPSYARSLEEGRLFCGADLEAAVNAAYVRSVRSSIPEDGWVRGDFEEVVVTEEILAESLAAAPRSVQPDSIERFVADIERYCGRDIAASIRVRLSPEEAVGWNGEPDGVARFRRMTKRVPRPLPRRRR